MKVLHSVLIKDYSHILFCRFLVLTKVASLWWYWAPPTVAATGPCRAAHAAQQDQSGG